MKKRIKILIKFFKEMKTNKPDFKKVDELFV